MTRLAGRLLGAARVAGLALVFVAATAGFVVLHLGTPPGRRVVARAVSALLDHTLAGRFELGAMRELTPRVVVLERFVARDPDGRVVLDARDLRVRADVPRVLMGLVAGKGANVVIEHTRLERAEVTLAPLRNGRELGLVAAFTPRPTPGPPSSTPPPRLWLANVELGRASAHAELEGLPALDAVVTEARGQLQIAPSGLAVDAEHFSAVLRGLFGHELRAVGSFHERGTRHFFGSLDGYAGDLQFDSIVRLDGKHLAVTLDVPQGEPKVVRGLLPAWPVLETVTAHAEAEGDLPVLTAKARATAGDTTVDVTGTVKLAPEVALELAVRGEAVDLRTFLPDAPETRLRGAGTLTLASSERGVELAADGTSEPAVVGAVPVPGASFHLTYEPTRGLAGSGSLAEPGMPLSATFALRDGTLSAEAHAPRFALERVPRLARLLGVHGTATLTAQATVTKGKLAGTLSADVAELGAGELALARGHVVVRASGPVSTPRALRVDATVQGAGLRWQRLSFGSAGAKVSGPLARLAVSVDLQGARGLSLKASTELSALGKTRLDNVELTLARRERSLHAHAGHVSIDAGSLEFADVRLEGAGGTFTGSGRYRPDLVEVDARGKDLNLGLLRRTLGIPGPRVAGKLDVTAEVAIARDVRRGTLTLALRDGRAFDRRGITADLRSSLQGENLEGDAAVAVEGLGRLRSSFDVRVEGSLLKARSWQHATGRVDLGLERLELAELAGLLPPSLGIEKLAGALVAQATLLRERGDAPPNVTLLAATDALEVTRKPAGAAEPHTVRGIDGQLSGHLDAEQGFAQADLRVIDGAGLLASGSGRIELDLHKAFAEPKGAWSLVRTAPVAVTLILDGRPLDELPVEVRPAGVAGTLRAELGLRGTLAEPRLSAKASLEDTLIGDEPEVVPFDACARLQYDPSAERVGLGLQVHRADPRLGACAGPRVAVGSATGTIDPAALARGERAYRGEAQLAFEDFPLELVPPLAVAGMVGGVRGVVALTDTSGLPAVNARLRLSNVAVHEVPVGTGDLTLRSDGRTLVTNVELERSGGKLDAEARAALGWEASVPVLDRTQPVAVRAKLEDIDAAVLSPLVGDVLADLSGHLDGNVALTLAPFGSAAHGRVSELEGKLSLRGGSLQIAGLGMRLADVGFEAQAHRQGARTVIAVRKLAAASGAKRQNVSAAVDLYLDGLDLDDARATVNLSQVPLLVEGVSQANLTGSASLELFPHEEPKLVAIQLHDLTASLPRSSGRAVLELGNNPDIHVKQPLAEPQRGPKGGSVNWRLAFDLARKVRVTRSDMELPVRGRPVLDLGQTSRVTGDIELEPGGRVQLLGKGFVIESGEVHFDTPDPSNPHLRVQASWRAPEGTTVYVDVGGTVRQVTLHVESDPPLTEAQIYALLLGGEGGDARTTGFGLGADLVAELLADTPLKRVELRAGSETSADEQSYSTYSAVVPVAENVWVELSYKSLDTTGTERSDAASAVIDWRFKRDWSLRTEAGTIGTGLDLLWQYRY